MRKRTNANLTYYFLNYLYYIYKEITSKHDVSNHRGRVISIEELTMEDTIGFLGVVEELKGNGRLGTSVPLPSNIWRTLIIQG